MSNLATIVNNILADSGIDDINVVVTNGSYSNPAWITALSWSKITSTPTTLSGYGITDAVPANRTITINGTAQDLSVNRSWSVGTVTSVDMTVPTGFSISGRPITSSGTLALTFSAGYSLPTTAVQSNWTTAYNDSIVSAAVSGTTTKTLTLTQQDGGTITASWTDYDTAPVTSVNAGTGISVNQTTGAVTVTNTGVLSINGSTGAVTGIITTSNYTSYAVAAYGTSAGDIDADWGQSFKTFDPVPSGTPPISSPNIRTINVGNDYNRRTQMAFNYESTRAFFRRRTEGGWSTWAEFIHSLNYTDYAVQTASQSNWNNYSVIANVVGLLTWKNYGNNHVIFDASQSTSPSGTSVNNTNSQVAWSATYPTLMGWNGSNTYGVRVDSSRVSDSSTYATSAGSATTAGSTPLLTASGSLTTQFGNGTIGYVYAINSSTAGLFSTSDNSNGIITINRHPDNYYSQLGFNSSGTMFYRSFNATAINTTQPWQTILTSSNYNSYSPTLTGTGASGTWSINVTGTAASETLATVTGRGATTSSTLNLDGRVNIGNGLSRPNALNSDAVAQARIGGADVHLYIASLGVGGGYKVAVQAARTSDFQSFDLDLQSNGGTLRYGGTEVVRNSGTWGISITGNSGSANYTQTLALTSLGNGSVNVNNANTAVYRNENGLGAALAYAPVLHLGGGDTMWQMQGTYGTSGSGTLYFRQGYNGSWGTWLTMLSSSNYNNYSPTLTGGGASGTWGINITGNAATATTASYASDSNLLDGQDGTYYDQRIYTRVDNYLGGFYVSGGSEKPNNAVFGAGKLKIAMLSGSNLGFSGPWNDVLWISTYNGGDVKSSHALVFDKYSTNVWVSDQDFDSGSWGTGYLLLHSGNFSSFALPITGGTLTGNRPITLDTGGGAIITQANAGGWSMGTYYKGSAGTTLAGFGAYGGADSLTWAWIGPGYEAPWMTINSGAAVLNTSLTINGVWSTTISTSGGWNKLSFVASNAWGDGVTYGVLGAGGGAEPGVMTYNQHATWVSAASGAGVRMGRSGGVSTGAWYQVATMSGDEFMIAKNGQWSNGGLKIASNGLLYYGETGHQFVYNTGTWSISVTGNSATTNQLNFGGGTVMNNSAWAGGGGYHGYSYSGGNFRFGFSSTSGVVDVYADGNFYATDNSYLVLHTANYNSYAPTLTGGGASGTWGISITGNAATVSSITGNTGLMVNRLTPSSFIDAMTSTTFRSYVFGTSANGAAISAARWNNVPPALSGMNSYGTLIAWAGDSDTQGFIATDYNTANAQIGGGYGNNLSWKATLLHSINYNSYSPTLTGGGASGTWGINITGNAATASSASSATSASSAGTQVGRYRGTFTVGGSTSTFYPVAFQIGSGSTNEQGIAVLQIERGGYDEPGYSSTGFGTFHCRIRAKADGWGYGASYVQLEQNAYTIPMLADFTQQNQTSQLIVWLRGGQAYRWLDVEGGWTLNFDNSAGGNYVTFSGNVTYTPTTTNEVGAKGKWFKGWSDTKCEGFIESESDVRAPIFYDSKNTAFYADLNSLSNIQRLQTQQNWYDNSASDWGGGINLKGTACTVGWQPNNSSWWYMMHTSSDDMNFYRRNTAGGAWNQDGIWDEQGTLSWRERFNLGSNGATPYSTEFLPGITFGGNEANEGAYRIYTKLEDINGNYTKLNIGWHTGIKIGASSSYGGTRFFNNSPYSGTKIFSIGEGDNHVRAVFNMYAAAFFETSDRKVKDLVENNYRANEIELIKPRLYKKNGILEVGYFAQDFENILPTAVSVGNDGLLSLSYTQVHTAKIAYLEDSIEEIKAKILYLENQLKTKQ